MQLFNDFIFLACDTSACLTCETSNTNCLSYVSGKFLDSNVCYGRFAIVSCYLTVCHCKIYSRKTAQLNNVIYLLI